MTFPVLSANGPSGYNLTRSLRTRSSASAYLNRTPATTTNQTTFTWSGWVKRGVIGSGVYGTLFYAGGNSTYWFSFRFGVDSLQLIATNSGGGVLIEVATPAVFRDPSSWYHIVLKIDSTQATAANRVIIYVNNVQQSLTVTTQIAQNQVTSVNTNVIHTIGQLNYASTYYFDGYLAEVNFIDGQALTPSSFGSTNATTGVWQPAKYTGTYGTNGFYLPFTDNSALTTSSNAGLGKDFSGNANYWVTNNISITAGATYDSMTDVPTLTSATAANFAVLNPLFVPTSAGTTNATLTSGNLQFVGDVTTDTSSRSTIGVTSGKWYCEVLVSVVSANQDGVGIAYTQSDSTRSIGVIYRVSGDKCVNNTVTAYGTNYAAGSLIGIALDADASTVTFYNNNVLQGAISFTPTTAIYFSTYGTNAVSSFAGNINFGQRPFSYTPPSGYVALNTYNLPASTVPNGAAYMAATLYTGNGYPTAGTQTIANTVGSVAFQPDFAWIKIRSAAGSHVLTDSVRGVNSQLFSNLTAAQETNTDHVTAFTSSGFSLGSGTTGIYPSTNNNGATYVAWQWKGGGTAVSNTNGSITSSVSANTTSGCSVVGYTGNGTNGATVGHGLGVAPSMVIVKNRNAAGSEWMVYHANLTANNNLSLDLTIGQAAISAFAGGGVSAVSSTTFTATQGSVNINNVNSSGQSHIAYCFAAIKGFSAFGSYTGNGSTDSPFVYLGFRPRFVLIKSSSGVTNWNLWDSSRLGYNVTNLFLCADLSDAETSFLSDVDFLSNGFKLRTSWTSLNQSGATYIYAAFAENPLNYSLAR